MISISMRSPGRLRNDFGLFRHSRPVLVGLGHEAGDVPGPLLPDVFVVVEVELAVDDREGGGVDRRLVAARHAEGAEAVIDGRIFRGIRREGVAVGRRREVEHRSFVLGPMLGRALDRLLGGEVRHGVEAADGNALVFEEFASPCASGTGGNRCGCGERSDDSLHGRFPFSGVEDYRKSRTWPWRSTRWTCRSAERSAAGSPCTMSKSAAFPGSTVPTSSRIPR